MVNADDRFAEAAAEAIGRLGDKCLELDRQRGWLLEALEAYSGALASDGWLLEALEAYSGALASAVEAVTESGSDELREDVYRRIRAILTERCDFSEQEIERVFGKGKS